MTDASEAENVKNELTKIVLAGLRKPWTVSSAVVVEVFTKWIPKQKYLHPIMPHAAPGCAPTSGTGPYFTGL
jgi:hypothetical protein